MSCAMRHAAPNSFLLFDGQTPARPEKFQLLLHRRRFFLFACSLVGCTISHAVFVQAHDTSIRVRLVPPTLPLFYHPTRISNARHPFPKIEFAWRGS